jgi:hypothetical protein
MFLNTKNVIFNLGKFKKLNATLVIQTRYGQL